MSVKTNVKLVCKLCGQDDLNCQCVGPWQYEFDDNRATSGRGKPNWNRETIAELLEALEALLDEDGITSYSKRATARAAIRKAKGEL